MSEKVFNIEELFEYLRKNDLLTNNKDIVKMQRIFLNWTYQNELNYDQLIGIVKDITSIVGEKAFIRINIKVSSKNNSIDPKNDIYQLESATIDTNLISKTADEEVERGMKSVW